MTSQQITTSYFSSKLTEWLSLLKSYRAIKFANKLNSYKIVSKKFGDVKKISLFERAKWNVASSLKFLVGGLFAY